MCQVKGSLPVTLPRNTLTLSVESDDRTIEIEWRARAARHESKESTDSRFHIWSKKARIRYIALVSCFRKKPVMNPGVLNPPHPPLGGGVLVYGYETIT